MGKRTKNRKKFPPLFLSLGVSNCTQEKLKKKKFFSFSFLPFCRKAKRGRRKISKKKNSQKQKKCFRVVFDFATHSTTSAVCIVLDAGSTSLTKKIFLIKKSTHNKQSEKKFSFSTHNKKNSNRKFIANREFYFKFFSFFFLKFRKFFNKKICKNRERHTEKYLTKKKFWKFCAKFHSV